MTDWVSAAAASRDLRREEVVATDADRGSSLEGKGPTLSIIPMLLLLLAGAVQVRHALCASPTSIFFYDEDAVIRYEAYRSCKECQAYEVVFFSDGRVQYTGKALVKVTGVRSYQIDRHSLERLIGAFKQEQFLELGGDYIVKGLADGKVAEISVRLEGKQKTIRFHYAANVSLTKLATKIDQTAETKQLICPISLADRKIC